MSKKDHFKGLYFKCSTKDKTIAFIPAYHRNNYIETASLQIITDETAFNIPFDSFEYSEKPLFIKLENCLFSERVIKLNIRNDNLDIRGMLRLHRLSPIRYNIMGPFQFVTFMQCSHSVYSMRHQIDGEINLNGQQFDFRSGTGYIEGDCGRSFPNQYIWTQSCFENGSLMLSVADIPLLGFNFTGIIGIVLLNEREYRIATYLGAKLKHLGENTVTVRQGDYLFTAKLIKINAQPLYAPNNGKMNRTIHESASSTAYYSFSYKGKPLCEFTSDRASFEFEYT